MTLLTDLTALDLSVVTEATGAIRATVGRDDLQALVGSEASTQVLGELGQTIDLLVQVAEEPETLLAPLAAALDELQRRIDLRDLPIASLTTAVADGARLLATMLGEADLGSVGALLTGALGTTIAPFGDHVPRALGELGQFRALVDTVAAGVPSDPADLAGLAIDVLLPLPRSELTDLATRTRSLLGELTTIELRAGATQGVVVALDAVTAAAVAGDDLALREALERLPLVRASAITNLAADLRRLAADVAALRVDAALRPIASVASGLHDARDGAIEQLDAWRTQVADARGMIARIDPERIAAELSAFLDELETWAQAVLHASVDAQVDALRSWLRDLFGHLPLRQLRAEVTAGIQGLASAVREAGVDTAVRDLRRLLEDAEEVVTSADLAGPIRTALAGAQALVVDTIEELTSRLAVVASSVEAVAGEAEVVLSGAVEGLAAFRTAIDEVQLLLSAAGIDAAGQQVAGALAELRETAEQLLSVAPLPDALRPLIDQLVASIEAIDLDEVLRAPLEQAAAQLVMPPELGAELRHGLAAAAEATRSLVPKQLIADLDDAIGDVVAGIRAFDPATLLADVTAAFADAAALVGRLDPRPAAAALRPTHEALLEALDAAHPRRLLAPAIAIYDQLMGAIDVPDPATTARHLAQTTGTAGTELARAATRPLSRLVPEAEVVAPDRPPAEAPPPLPATDDLRAGDVIRLLGWLPARLREGIEALDDEGATALLADLDAVTGSLANDLRRIAADLHGLEERLDRGLDEVLEPVAAAQMRAQLAVQARARTADGAASLDVDVDLAVIASLGPSRLRDATAADQDAAHTEVVRASATLAGATAGTLERTAATLAATRVGGLTGDLDAFLAALDPEPLAAEVDAMVVAALDRAPDAVVAMGGTLRDLDGRISALIRLVDPGQLLERFLPVVDVLREQVELLDPGRLADELGEVHLAVRAAVAAFDPAVVATELYDVVEAVVAQLQGLDPASLLGDLTPLADAVARVEQIVPGEALAAVGGQLVAVGVQLEAIDVAGLLTTVEDLPDAVSDALVAVAGALKAEILALLKAIRYVSASGSITVNAEVRS
jgi:hypothetical protein